MISIELHCHTYYSDGRPSPRELVETAVAQGVRILAITDHDNARGAREASPLARQLGLELIPAIEFSTYWAEAQMPPGESDVDLLGYLLDIDSAPVLQAEADSLADQRARIGVWCEEIRRAGVHLEIADLLAINPRYPGNLQLAQALKACGFATDEAIDRLLRPMMKAIPPAQLPTAKAIDLIHATGGAVVLAHPAANMVNWHGSLLDYRSLGLLVEMGLDGIEVYHFRVDEPTRAHFIALAKKFNLAVTGGSDEHGWPEGLQRLGSQPVTPDMVSALAARSRSTRS